MWQWWQAPLALMLCAAALAWPLWRARRAIGAALRGEGSVRQTLSNAGVGALFLAVQLLLRGAVMGLFAWAATHVPYKLPDAPWALCLTLLALDFVYYVQHRLEHALPVLWAIHAVHHQSQDYNLSVSLRVGALSGALTSLFHLPLALLGVRPAHYVLATVVHASLLFCLHARTQRTLGPGRYFNAPRFHRLHHATNAAYLDKNFGGVLLVFDRWFGTFAAPSEPPTVGVLDEPAPQHPLRANVAPWQHLAARVAARPNWRGKLHALCRHDPS